MKDIITSADPLSASTQFGIYRLKAALARGDKKSAEEILNSKKYDRPVQYPSQYENDELISKTTSHGQS